MRNRLSSLGSRNKRMVGEGLQELSRRLDFRCIDGLAERVIFREFYPRGLTALDDLDETTLGTRPTMSHVTARLEIENLLDTMGLGEPAASNDDVGHARTATRPEAKQPPHCRPVHRGTPAPVRAAISCARAPIASASPARKAGRRRG